MVYLLTKNDKSYTLDELWLNRVQAYYAMGGANDI